MKKITLKDIFGKILTSVEVEDDDPRPMRTALESADVDLDYIDLRGADLRHVYLSDVCMRGATLSRACLVGAYLNEVNLVDANLQGSNFRGATLRSSNLSDALLTDADFTGAVIDHCFLIVDTQPPHTEQIRAEMMIYRLEHPDVPVVEDLDRKILDSVSAGLGCLDMSAWHRCRTTHCRAGWAITKAGEAGRVLDDRLGPERAGAQIYMASTGRVPDFFAEDHEALEDIRRCAGVAS